MKTITILIFCLLMAGGCTTYKAEVMNPQGKVIARVQMFYFLNDKKFGEVRFNPETKLFEIIGAESETSQIVGAAVRAALGGG